jgi:hypothetical protein
MGIFTAICTLFSCTPKQYTIDPMFIEMRDLFFSVDPKELNIEKEYENQIYAVIMETGYKDVALSLRCFADGTISIYYTSGGGMIGIGEHVDARKAGLSLVEESKKNFKKFELVKEFPLPKDGQTIFYLLTSDGVYSFIEKENTLGNNQSELSPFFYKAQDVITQARLIDEKL